MTATSEIDTNEVMPIINNDEAVEEDMEPKTMKSNNALTRVLAAACVLCVIFLASMNSSGPQPADVEGRRLPSLKRCDMPDSVLKVFCCCTEDTDCEGDAHCVPCDRRLSEEDEAMAAIRGSRLLNPGACKYC